MPMVFMYFIPFQKKKYTKKLRGDLDMNPCQFISHTLAPMIFLVTSSFKITWVIKFLLCMKRSLETTSQFIQLHGCIGFSMSTYTDGVTLPFPPTPYSKTAFFTHALERPTLSLCNIVYILHSNAWLKVHVVWTETNLATLSIFLGVIAYQDWDVLNLPDVGNAGKFPQLSNSELHRLLKFLQISSFSL